MTIRPPERFWQAGADGVDVVAGHSRTTLRSWDSGHTCASYFKPDSHADGCPNKHDQEACSSL